METLQFLNIQNDLTYYQDLIEAVGVEQADVEAIQSFSNDFSSLNWEINQKKTPFSFYYKLIPFEDGIRMIHQRDYATGRDLLSGMRMDIRDGLEFAQMSKVKQSLLETGIGAVTSWISPKKLTDDDPEYPLTFINKAVKINASTVWVWQYQGDFDLGDRGLEDIMLDVSHEEDGWLEEGDDVIGGFMESGKAYLEAIKSGLSGGSLSQRYVDILRDTIDIKDFQKLYSNQTAIMTSCGWLDFSPTISKVFGSMLELKINNWCPACHIENSCTTTCYRCNSKLVSKSVSYN